MRAMLSLPYMAPLATFVAGLRKSRPEWQFPDFDPLGGGILADMLFLFEKPGPMAGGSGFISMCNDDPTAEHSLGFIGQAGIPYSRLAIWNVMPGWNGAIRFIAEEHDWGMDRLSGLLALLPELRVAVLVGRQAQKAAPLLQAHGLPIVESAHPAMRVRNSAPEKWAAIPGQWAEARAIADARMRR
jgi:hypothetical protein